MVWANYDESCSSGVGGFRDSGIFVVVVGRLSANRWAQYPQGCPVSSGGQDQPMAGFARISVILGTRRGTGYGRAADADMANGPTSAARPAGR